MFLSFPLWHFFEVQNQGNPNATNPFIERLEDFLDLCEQRGLRVVPVLWDSVGGLFQPRYAGTTLPTAMAPYLYPGEVLTSPPGVFPQANLSGWHASPGWFSLLPDPTNPRPTSPASLGTITTLAAGEVITNTPAEDYVRDCIDAFATHPNTLLMWDVCNEPKFPAQSDMEPLIVETMRLIKTYPAPTTPPTLNRRTSFSPVYVTDGHPAAVRIAVKLLDANDQPINPNLTQSQDAQEATNEPLCDVIGIHPYGHSWLTIDTMIFDAQHINPDPSASSIPQSGTFHKQVYCSEAGYPGAGMSYVDAIGYCRNAWQTKRDGTPLQGVGYCPWMLMTGAIGERLPYGEGTGFFFTIYENPNGTIRAKDEWLAVHTHARTQGAPGLFAQGAAPTVMTINFQWPIPADIDSSAYYAHGGGFFEPTAAPGSLTPWPPNAAIQGMDYWTLESHLALLGELTDWFSFESSSFASNNGNPWLGYQGVPYRLEAADAIKLLHPEFGYAEVFNPRKKPGGIAAFSPFPNPPVYFGWELGKWLIEANSAGTIPHGTFAPEDPANPNQTYHLWHLKWYAQDWVNHLDRYINAETTGRAVIH